MQRQVQTRIERKDSLNMQVSKDWNTFRSSRLALLSVQGSKTDQAESPRLLRLFVVRRSLESRSINIQRN